MFSKDWANGAKILVPRVSAADLIRSRVELRPFHVILLKQDVNELEARGFVTWQTLEISMLKGLILLERWCWILLVAVQEMMRERERKKEGKKESKKERNKKLRQ